MDCSPIIIELKNALSLIMSPHTDPNLRRTAYQYCEDFKDKSENCAECGVYMASVENDQIIRHFGLQLLEHCIKFKWNDMSLDKKQFIKTNALSLISSGTLDISSEHSHIKDAMSRIMVEIAKREWPQQWMFMINELDAISSRGMTQTEIVLMIFLRLVEDVLIFQTTPPQRRKEISQGLTAIMNQLFAFFCSTLTSNYAAFKSNRNNPGYAKVISVTCEVICAFMENLSINLLISDNGSLIFLLLEMLEETQLNSSVADCLLEIASKKGKIEERIPLIDIFLKIEALNKMEQVAITSEKNCISEQGFLFFKKLCQVLVVIGTQICSIQTYAVGSKFPSNFDKYIGLMFSFTIHPSQAISCYCMSLWMSLLKCSKFAEQDIVKHCLSQIFSNATDMILRNGCPSQDNHIRCTYSRFDFDCDEEFAQFQRKYKAEVCDVLRTASTLYPEQAFEFITARLTHLLNKTFNSGQEGGTSLASLYAEWEAVGSCLEAVVEKMDFKIMNEKVVLSTIALYKQILEFHSPDPTLCSDILSIVSAFFPIISQDPTILPKVLDKLFACMLFNIPGQTKSTRSKMVKNVRRHACSILIKICKMYPLLLLPGFNYLYDHIKKLTTNPEELSQMEKSTCFEALILIHNEVKNYNEQANFLREIIQQISPYWLSESVTQTLWSSDKLMDFIGVTRPPVEPSSQDVCGINRSQIQYCLSLIMGVLKRSTWPSSEEEAKKGGFIQEYTSDTTPIYRSPAAEVVIPLLNNVFGIIKSYHEIFQSDKYKKIYPAFIPALQLTESEKYNILGIIKPQSNTSIATTKDPVERMQAFFNTMTEASYNILGNSCKYLNVEFYGFPSVENVVLHSVLNNIFNLPEFRIKHLIHTFLKPFVQNCPKEYYSKVLLVVLKAMCPYFYQYLTNKWQVMSNKRNNESQDQSQDYSDSQESQEMLEEQILRSLTKEYMDMIDYLMRDKKSSTPGPQQSSSNGSSEMCDDAMMDDCDAASLSRKGKEDVLGELGQLILAQEDIYPSIVLLIFVSLSWEDSTICGKTVIWCYPILKQLVSLQKVTVEYASDFIRSILYGLNIHGQHDSVLYLIINALLQSYELLVVNFPSIAEILLKIPGCTSENLNNFNSRFIFAKSQGKGFEKKKREHFKTLVDGVVQKNIGQRYKNPVHIKNLAPFRLFRQKQKELLAQEDVEDAGLCSLFSGAKN